MTGKNCNSYNGENVRLQRGGKKDADEIVPLSYSELAQQRYTNASLKVIPKAGHGYEGEDSENARKLSIDFIKRNER